jgi:F-type H+-transporting ATPase subunit beta
VLSRKRASEGLFPAIDPLQSNSKMATPGIVGERHYALAQEIRRTLAQYGELKDIIAMLGLEQLSPEDRKVVVRARLLERFLTQPFFTTEQFTGLTGKLVSLKDSLDGCERILHDEFKDYPESGLYMIGPISEAKGKPKPVSPAGPPTSESKPETKAKPDNPDDATPVAKVETKAEAKPKFASEVKPKADLKPTAVSPAKPMSEPSKPPEANPKPKAEHAEVAHAS